ncbi:MAG: hypothetical protein M9899_06250 [Bdellovibrionaceae bacterium]|nr:hypothetical protein [Pseudobdellovibrionaceae bacterium]
MEPKYHGMDPNGDQKTTTNSAHNGVEQVVEMHLRCPTCFKLYAVDAKTIYVPKPEFQCTQCEQKFWVNFPEALEFSEVVAFPVEWSENYNVSATADEMAELALAEELESNLLSKMSFETEKLKLDYQEASEDENSERSALKFGIEYEKSVKGPVRPQDLDFVEEEYLNTPEVGSVQWLIDREWEKVINHYDVKAFHDGFISEGKKLNALELVYEKYKNIKEANSFDPVAKARFKQVERMVQRYATSSNSIDKPISTSPTQRGLKSYYKYLPWISLGVAGILVAAGFSHESLNHLAGLGFALIFLTGALSLLKESDL